LKQNRGKGHALRTGLASGKGRYLGFIDGDGDIPPDLLADFVMISRREKPAIITGSKRHPDSRFEYSLMRRFYSWGYQVLTRALFGLEVRDTQVGIKLIRRDVAREVLPLMVEDRYAFDLELFALAKRLGYDEPYEAPVRINHREGSTISAGAVASMLCDTLGICWRVRIKRVHLLSAGAKGPAPCVERTLIGEMA
jgi:glycosyltransferase involved in cell wall biosynthesis